MQAIKIISIHAPREGSDLSMTTPDGYAGPISIHAPREGSDLVRQDEVGPGHISIHAPREGSDVGVGQAQPPAPGHFYPRSPRGERPTCETVPANPKRISIHAPREGSDGSRRSIRSQRVGISIHAPREGSD